MPVYINDGQFMRNYSEIGYGNATLISTERDEVRTATWVKGRAWSWYIRIWVGHWVLIIDTVEGLKTSRKPRSTLKLLIGKIT